MFQRLTQSAVELVELLGVEGKILVNLLARSAGLAVLMLVAAMIAGVALLGIVAAAVIALAPQMGTASALTLVSVVVLLICTIAVAALWSMTLNIHKQAKLDSAERKLELQKQKAIERLNTPEPTRPASPFSALSGLNLGKIDPVLAVASVGAAAAVIGPVRLLRIVGGLAANFALISSLVSAGKSAMSGAVAAHSDQHAPTGLR